MLKGLQIKTARKLLGLANWRLAQQADISMKTLSKAENTPDLARLTPFQEERLRRIFEEAGLEFTADENGPGVRLRNDLEK
jgi:hypothetical protein